MSVAPGSAGPETPLSPVRLGPGHTGGYLSVESRARYRRPPSPWGLTRRRWLIMATKVLLPAGSLVLLASIALWPEFERATDKARIVMHDLGGTVDGARVRNARYNGVDEHGRPFTVTAETATQTLEDRVDLTAPNADMTLENKSWLDIKAKHGVFTRKLEQLDLSDDVVLYRDDGTTMTTASATVDVKAGVATGSDATHVEGPFGTLDAAGFTTTDKGAVVRFWGPAHALLNGMER